MDDIVNITLHVAETLERMGVRYLVGGSLASSLHGIPRATLDVDLVAELRTEHVAPLVRVLHDTFYVDARMIRDAIERRSSFNLIHLETMFKVDVFLPKDDDVSRLEMARRRSYVVSEAPHQLLVVASPEDVVAQKLHWYRLGEEVSERQWSDVLGVLKVQQGLLDQSYLRHVAALLGVSDLLERALADA